MRKVLDKVEKTLITHTVEFTDFLDPYQRRLCYSFLNRFMEVNYHEEGGLEGAERKIIVIYPHYMDKSYLESYIGAIRLDGSFRFNDLNHRDYLGAILGLGIKREKIGDILVHEKYTQVILHKDIIDYVILNLKKIGKEPVKVKEIKLHEINRPSEKFKEIIRTVASLRIDSLLSAAYGISRSGSLSYIKNGRVKLNWQPIDTASYKANEGDMISVRGKGRFKLYKVLGETRKGRQRVAIKIFK
ncbi:RNA-binding protein [Thermohalobacter berrensis]|nr:YlmH/Sll1252 family protein [Thermohalobacter berrensis]